jgi:hypothetical protein
MENDEQKRALASRVIGNVNVKDLENDVLKDYVE